jgi:diguanylate cyclase (GGDEF)-like protein
VIPFVRIRSDGGSDDPLEAYRDRAMYLMSVVALGAITPLVVHNIVRGRYLLAASIACVLAGLAIDAAAIRRRRRPPLPYIFMAIPAAFAIGLALKTQGVIGIFWCYPLVLGFYFVLRRRIANYCSFAFLVGATLGIHHWIGDEPAVRFFLSLALTIIIINIVLNIIADLQRRLVEQAITDPLTGAYNRRHMQMRLEEAIERHRRTGAPASLLLCDIDHFKRINDAFGHEAGDNVLKELVQLIGERLRKGDLLFRLGGEEFLVLLHDTPVAAAVKVAEAMRATIAQSHFPVSSAVTVSFGVTGLEASDSPDSWVGRADRAMYLAKKAGRNRVMTEPVPDGGHGTVTVTA